jgi:glycosyltransferase involved in cell wall biosynthesis
MDSKFLTIIIPCYKEVDRLPLFLNDLYTQLNHLDINFIIVDDGSPIEDFNKMKNLIDPFLSEKFKLLRYEKNLGKGGAISYGLTHASSDYIGFVDADGSIPFYEIENIAKENEAKIKDIEDMKKDLLGELDKLTTDIKDKLPSDNNEIEELKKSLINEVEQRREENLN